MSNDIIKIADGSNPPAEMADGELAIDEINRLLYIQTNRGAVPVPLNRMALELTDENASSEVYVYRANGVAEHVELNGGGGGPGRDDRAWRVFGMAPASLGSATLPHSGIIEISTPTTITAMQVLAQSGTGDVTVSVYAWDGAQGTLMTQQTITVSDTLGSETTMSISLDPGRYQILTEGAGITLESIVGYMPWNNNATHVVNMSEV